MLLRLEHYFWPPFRSAASTIIGLALSAFALVLTDNLVWVAVAVSTGFGVALLLLALELTHAVGVGPFDGPDRTALYAVIGMRGKSTTSVTGGILGGQVFVFLERALAASLGVGAVTAISYARGVAFTPTIVAGSIALGVYPGLLRAHAAGDAHMLRSTFLAGLRSILFVAVCTAAYVALYAESVTGLLFGHGKLNPNAQHEVSRALAAFSVAVVGTMLMIITARVFGAIDRFHGIVVSQGIALALYVPLALALRPGLGPAGLALAFGVAELTGATYAVLRCARYVAYVCPRAPSHGAGPRVRSRHGGSSPSRRSPLRSRSALEPRRGHRRPRRWHPRRRGRALVVIMGRTRRDAQIRARAVAALTRARVDRTTSSPVRLPRDRVPAVNRVENPPCGCDEQPRAVPAGERLEFVPPSPRVAPSFERHQHPLARCHVPDAADTQAAS